MLDLSPSPGTVRHSGDFVQLRTEDYPVLRFVLPCKAATGSEGALIWLILKYYLECNLIFKYYSECNQKPLTLGTQSRCFCTFLSALQGDSLWPLKNERQGLQLLKSCQIRHPRRGTEPQGLHVTIRKLILLFLVSCAFLLYLDLFWLPRLFISRH